jgi:hypothetical protein
MTNRLLVVGVLLLAHLGSGCASTSRQTALGQSPDEVTDAIARQGKGGDASAPNAEPKHPDSPRWSYVTSKLEDVAMVVVCAPVVFFWFLATGAVNTFDMNTKP